MSETRSVTGSGAGRAEREERLDETSSGAPPLRVTIRRRPSLVPLPPLGPEVLRALTGAPVPLAVADLSLYTDEALEREIDGARARPASDGGLLVLGRLEGELARRRAPKAVDLAGLATSAAVKPAIDAERTFLARHGAHAGTPLRTAHETTLRALEERRAMLRADERACDDARPVVGNLRDGAHRIDVTAEDLIATLRKQRTLGPRDEAQVRATFERWHRDTCRATGDDPTVTVSKQHHAELRVDRNPAQQEALQLRLEMLEASRSSVLGALAFLASAARGESVDAAHRRVMAAVAVGDVAFARAALAPATVPRVRSLKAEAREVEGLGRKIVDDARGAGHAQNTRFRNSDNSQFIKDPDAVTYGPWRKNATGPRTVEEAKQVFEKHTGQKLPPWLKVVADPKVPSDRHAEYVFEREGDVDTGFARAHVEEKGVVVRLRPDVLESDEAIVGVLRHESYELEQLVKKLETGKMSKATVRAHIAAGRGQNLHGQAWDVADLEVRIMREKPGTPAHAQLAARREALVSRFELQNHGEPE